MPDIFYDYYGFPQWITEDYEKLHDVSKSYARSIAILASKEAFPEPYVVKSERDIFPLITLIHIYIELVFKCLLLFKDEKITNGHDLVRLYKKVKKQFPDFNLREGEALLSFLDEENKQAQSFRYNFDKKTNELFLDLDPGIKRGVSFYFIYNGYFDIQRKTDDYYAKNIHRRDLLIVLNKTIKSK